MAGPTKKPLPSGASPVYEALTDWIDLSQPIKTAWDAGPDNDPGSYHPDNLGDWTLTRTAGTPGTLTLAGTTGASARVGWSNFARFDLGAVATLLGVDSSVLTESGTVLMVRSVLAGLGTRNATAPGFIVQASKAASAPASYYEGGGAGFRWLNDSNTQAVYGAISNNVAGLGTPEVGEVIFTRTGRGDAGPNVAEQARFLVDTSGGLIDRDAYGGEQNSLSNSALTATARLWFGAGQWNGTAAAFTGFAASFEARLLKRNAVPWDADFGL